MYDLVQYAVHHHLMFHASGHRWVTVFDGEEWLSRVDALRHLLGRS